MSESIASPQATRAFVLVLAAALLAAASSVAWSQPLCDAPLAGAAAATGQGEKFRLITRLCPNLAEPATPKPAAQLALYDKPPVAIEMAASAPAPAAPASAPAAKAPVNAKPPTAAEQRILAIAPALSAAARDTGVDPLLMHAVAHVESRHNPAAVSKAGARGVMQVMPATGSRFGVTRPEYSLLDPHTNLRAAGAYLRTLLDRYGSDLKLVLAAYNAGEGAVAKYGNTVPPYPETQAYVRDVTAVYRRLSASFTVSRAGTLVAKGEL